MPDLDVDVLIVGGGSCGLSASIFLSDLGVDHLMIERHPTTSHLPKAHYLNARTMEILRQHGLAERVLAQGMPTDHAKVRYITGMGGDGDLDARELYTFDAFGGGAMRERYLKAAPEPTTNLPQLRLEPLLRAAAEERAPERVRFDHELRSFDQDEESVTAAVLDRSSGESYTVCARYLIASDGGRTVGPAVGVEMEGLGPIANLKTVHVTADLSPYIAGDALFTHVMRPGTPYWWIAVISMGPSWGTACEEWGVAFAFPPGDPNTLAIEDAPDAIREMLNLPSLEVEVHGGGDWLVERVVARHFRYGRAFLAGDAAHRHVPTAGLGLNSAVHDAHNLTWKLAQALRSRGDTGGRLLDSYEEERWEADTRNADWALFTFLNHTLIDAGLGVSLAAPVEMNQAALRAYFAEDPMGETLRARGGEVMDTQRTEYQGLDIDLGAVYHSGAVVADNTPAPPRDPMGCEYLPTTRPGHRLPHAWLRRDGERISTHDLVGRSGGFALLAGPEGDAWLDAARTVATTLGVEINAVTIGRGAHYADASGAWAEVAGTAPDGAVLVRPDNHVGYRAPAAVADPAADLERALRLILSMDRAPTPA